MRITLSVETISRIDTLKEELSKEFDWEYTREEIIEKAITAFEDVRNG